MYLCILLLNSMYYSQAVGDTTGPRLITWTKEQDSEFQGL